MRSLSLFLRFTLLLATVMLVTDNALAGQAKLEATHVIYRHVEIDRLWLNNKPGQNPNFKQPTAVALISKPDLAPKVSGGGAGPLDWFSAAFSAGLVIVGALQWKVLCKQATIINKQQVEGRAVQRAHIYLEKMQVEPVQNSNDIIVMPTWKNGGTTPAVKLITQSQWDFLEPEYTPDDYGFPDLLEPKWDQRPEKASRPASFSIGPNAASVPCFHYLSERCLLNARDQKVDIYFWGWVEYNDVFSDSGRHRTEYCLRLRVLSGYPQLGSYAFTIHPTHNAADSEELYAPPSAYQRVAVATKPIPSVSKPTTVAVSRETDFGTTQCPCCWQDNGAWQQLVDDQMYLCRCPSCGMFFASEGALARLVNGINVTRFDRGNVSAWLRSHSGRTMLYKTEDLSKALATLVSGDDTRGAPLDQVIFSIPYSYAAREKLALINIGKWNLGPGHELHLRAYDYPFTYSYDDVGLMFTLLQLENRGYITLSFNGSNQCPDSDKYKFLRREDDNFVGITLTGRGWRTYEHATRNQS